MNECRGIPQISRGLLSSIVASTPHHVGLRLKGCTRPAHSSMNQGTSARTAVTLASFKGMVARIRFNEGVEEGTASHNFHFRQINSSMTSSGNGESELYKVGVQRIGEFSAGRLVLRNRHCCLVQAFAIASEKYLPGLTVAGGTSPSKDQFLYMQLRKQLQDRVLATFREQILSRNLAEDLGEFGCRHVELSGTATLIDS